MSPLCSCRFSLLRTGGARVPFSCPEKPGRPGRNCASVLTCPWAGAQGGGHIKLSVQGVPLRFSCCSSSFQDKRRVSLQPESWKPVLGDLNTVCIHVGVIKLTKQVKTFKNPFPKIGLLNSSIIQRDALIKRRCISLDQDT